MSCVIPIYNRSNYSPRAPQHLLHRTNSSRHPLRPRTQIMLHHHHPRHHNLLHRSAPIRPRRHHLQRPTFLPRPTIELEPRQQRPFPIFTPHILPHHTLSLPDHLRPSERRRDVTMAGFCDAARVQRERRPADHDVDVGTEIVEEGRGDGCGRRRGRRRDDQVRFQHPDLHGVKGCCFVGVEDGGFGGVAVRVVDVEGAG